MDAAHKLGRPVTVQTVKPLPPSDRLGAVTGLLLLPLLIGGYLAAVLVFKAAGGTAAAPWRALILTGYAVVGALLTDLIAGPWIGAYSSSHFWPLLPCFALITTAVVLAAAAIQGLVGQAGTLLVAVLFIVVGGSGAGGLGTYAAAGVLAEHRRDLPAAERGRPDPQRDLLRRQQHHHPADRPVPVRAGRGGRHQLPELEPPGPGGPGGRRRARGDPAEAALAGNPATPPGRTGACWPILVALADLRLMECLFASNYMSAGHAPKATNLPFGVTGSSPILTAAEKTLLPQGHPVPERVGGQDRDRPGPDLGRADPGRHRARRAP